MFLNGFVRWNPRRWLATHYAGVLTVTALIPCPLLAEDNQFTVEPLFIAGGRGSDPGEFGIPESVIIDSRGQIAVTDKGRMMVHVFSRHTGEALFSVGGLGSAIGKFNRPNGIAVDSRGRILVVEQRNYRIQIFDADYNPLGEFGFRGSANGGFQKPMGIAIDSQDNIYVTDESREDVQVFDPEGAFLWKFAEKPRLEQVESIEVDERSRRIFVCDEGRSNINVYDLDGNYWSSFGEQGHDIGQFGNDPNAIRVDGRQRIWVNDQGNQRINVYRADTRFLASFYNAANGMQSADGIELSEPYNLLLVADQGHDRVLAFDLLALQAQLEVLELPAAVDRVDSLTAHVSEDYAGVQHPLWDRTRLFLEAHGSGDPTSTETAVVRVASSSDERGILVHLTESGPASGIFRGFVQLATHSEESTGLLRASVGDAVRAHAAGGAWQIVQQVSPLPPPEIHGLDIGPGAHMALHRRPSLMWSFHDPAGVRTQDAFEVTVLHEDASPAWSGGLQIDAGESFVLEEDMLPAGTNRLVRVRVRSGDLWSEPQSLLIRRNTPPPLARTEPADDIVLQQWPPGLRAVALEDADGQPLQLHFEARSPDGKLSMSQPIDLERNQWVEHTGNFNVMENQALHWRVLVDDGIETTSTPWQRVHRNEIDEDPRMPTLLGPAPEARGHDDELLFQWSAGSDPDPRAQLSTFFEWRHEGIHWQRQVASTESTHRWKGHGADGPIEWRILVKDQTGRKALTRPRRMTLERHWTAELRVVNHHDSSIPLIIGARPGAQDEYVRGEDTVVPTDDVQPQIVSRAPTSSGKNMSDGNRVVDIRRPCNPIDHQRESTYDIRLRGPAGAVLKLQASALELPTSWSLLWKGAHDADRIAMTLETSIPIRLDEMGESHGTIRVGPFFADEIEPLPRERSGERGVSRTSKPSTGETGNHWRIDLQRHLSLLANPLTPEMRLLPPGLTQPLEVEVFDARGRRMRRWSGRDPSLRASAVFGHSGLPSGVYLVRMRTATQNAQRKILWRR